MNRRRAVPLLLFAFALAIRLYGLRWDDGLLFHPDERRIAQAVGQISFFPLRLDPGFFAYGSLPFYVTRVAMALGKPFGAPQEFEGAILAGRVLSAFWGAAGVLLLCLLGRRLYGERVGIRAALFWAIAVLPVQNAHFATNDTALSTLVLLTLLLLVAAAESGRTFLFGAAGAVFGLAMATKVSALPVAMAALAALALARRRGTRIASPAVLFACTAALAFALGEPYTLLDSPAFLHDTLEQARMVRSAGTVPYTIQYVGTLPWLTPLRELVLWGLGPLLGLAAVWGTLRLARRRWTGPLAVLLAFLLPFLLVTGSFGVKFPRYLLPAYPLILLFAAAALEELPSRAGRLVRGTVLAGSLAYLAAFLGIYAREHTVRTASRWCQEHLPEGARLLGATWEEGFPDPERFQAAEFPFYDPDSAAKTHALAAELSRADAIYLPTKRIYGAILRDEARFPDTARAFRLLFSGDLGFTLEKDVSSRPRLLGISLPDELADESFSVYDHPRVLIFGNREHLPAQELEGRLLTWAPHRVLTRSDLLLGAPPRFASDTLPDAALRASLFSLLLLALLVGGLSIAGSAAARAALGNLPGVHALGPVVGTTLFAWLAFLGASVGIRFTRGPLLALAALLVAAGFALSRRLPRVPSPERRITAAVVWGSYLLFAALRAAQPEIFWGEKPMDFSFVNALERSVSLPPPEPWFSGSALHYTYFGHFGLVALGKAIGIAPGVLFNLGVALGAALFAGALLFAGSAAAGALRGGGGAVVLGLFAGNLAGLVELVRRRAVDFDLFWGVSRIVPGAINEFPFWSYLFADLHAHVLALPLAAAAAGILVSFTRRAPHSAALALLALLLGALAATNGWSVPGFAAITLLFCVAGALGEEGTATARIARGTGRALAVSAGAWAAFLPFWSGYSGPATSWGWERDSFARPHEMLLVFGLFTVLLVPRLGGGLRALARTRRPAIALGALLAALALVNMRHLPRVSEAASSAALAAVLLLLLAIAAFPGGDGRGPALLASAAFALVLGSELLFVWDRMNTVFKLWMDAWVLLAIACGGLLAEALSRARRRPLAVAALVLALATSALALAGWGASRHLDGPRGTLDGTAYLARHAPGEVDAIAWLNRNVRGLPTLVEACGPSYQGFTRVSMHTGLPVVLGWDYHVFQRGQDRSAVEERKEDVARLYRTSDPQEAQRLLRRWNVAWVFSGIEEERAYGPGVGERLRRLAPALVPAFSSGEVTVFRVGEAP